MKFVDIHTHNQNIDPHVLAIYNLDLNESFQNGYPYLSVGIHPWQLDKEYDLKEVQKGLEHKNVLALGEIGLDGAIDTPMELQKEIFTAQLILNKRLNKPVIIHNVKCLALLQIIKKDFPGDRWIIHGFNKGVEMAEQLLQLGCYLSFGDQLFVANSKAQEAFIKTPLESIFLETDDQQQYDIVSIYNKACELKKITIDEMQKQIIKNFSTVFGEDVCGLE